MLSDEKLTAYDAPLPDRRYKAGACVFPELATVELRMDGVAEAQAAVRFWSEDWSGDSFMAIGADDPDTDAMYAPRERIRHCPQPLVIEDAGHFVPEWGEPVARAA